MKLPRFWFRLRTLMIGVTLLAVALGYVGWQAKIVRERKAWLQEHRPERDPTRGDIVHSLGDKSKSPNAIRRWLGDTAVGRVVFSRMISKEDIQAALRLFPEAAIIETQP